MREIKFRAWDRREKKMYPPAPTLAHIHYPYVALGRTDDFTLMQYTGLKDKNGKEIYEGDVVKCANSSMPLLYVRWKDGDSGFCASDATMWFNFMLDGSFAVGIEVIGNIYENPGLV